MDRAKYLVCVALAAGLGFGCGHAAERSGEPRGRQSARGLANRAPPDTPLEAPMYPMDPDLPAWTFAHVPGWLAFTAQPAARRERGFTPAHPNATAVILQADPWSETVEEGTRFRLVIAEGNLPLTLSEVSQIPYGCDDIPTTMAAFRTPHDLAEQVAWILPESFGEARALPIQARAASAKERTYAVEDLVVRLALAGADRGELRIERQGRTVYTRAFERPVMDGAEDKPLDLGDTLAPGVPFLEAAFRLDPANAFLVLRALSHEGVRFEVVRVGRTVESAGAADIYLCAY